MEGDSAALDDLDNAGNENWKKGGKILLENPLNSFQQKEKVLKPSTLTDSKHQTWYLLHFLRKI